MRLLAVLVALGGLLYGTSERSVAQARAGDLAIVVHPGVPITDLPLSSLRQIFLGERQFWPGGSRITIFIPAPGTPERAAALDVLYRMDEAEFRRYWIAKTFRGDIAYGPKIVSTSTVARQLTGAIPGAVALLPATKVDSTVKLLRIQGKLPGESGYPLRVGAE